MSRNQELIEKYKRRITKMEKECDNSVEFAREAKLQSKISVYKIVIIDLLE